jgi:hypothetical protein
MDKKEGAVRFAPEPEASATWVRGMQMQANRAKGLNASEVMRILGDPRKGVTLQARTDLVHTNGHENMSFYK